MKKNKMNPELVAPCGMNCNVCKAYLGYSRNIPKSRKHNLQCVGCRPRKPRCVHVRAHCKLIRNEELKFCYECKDFPCAQLKRIDERYRTRYGASFIENLKFIEKNGLSKFLIQQEKKYRCAECGGTVSIHDGECYDCLRSD